MSLMKTLKADQLAARKIKDSFKATILTTLIGEAAMIGKNDGNRVTADAEVMKVIAKFVKGINETIKVRDSGELHAEKEILESYLPPQMNDEELKITISHIIYDLDATSMKDMGRVMGVLSGAHGGQYDGKVASGMVRELLK